MSKDKKKKSPRLIVDFWLLGVTSPDLINSMRRLLPPADVKRVMRSAARTAIKRNKAEAAQRRRLRLGEIGYHPTR